MITRSALLNGAPRAIQVAMRPEFVSRALCRCVRENGVTLDFSQLGKPTANEPVESFNVHLCDERLNVNWRLLRLTPGTRLRRDGGSARRRSSHRFGAAGAPGFRLGRPDKPSKETRSELFSPTETRSLALTPLELRNPTAEWGPISGPLSVADAYGNERVWELDDVSDAVGDVGSTRTLP